jgi:cytochrome P450
VTEYARRATSRWVEGQASDVEADMNALTHAVVVRAIFGVDVDDPAAGPLPGALREATEAYYRLPLPFSRAVARLPLPANRRYDWARARIDEIVREMIATRRSGSVGDDLLSRMVHGGDGSLSDLEVRDEAVTLFLPGRKPLATALTWTWYLLSQNPEAEGRLHAELDSALGGREPGPEDLERLPFTRMVFLEAMRLYPPAWIVLRKARTDHRIRGYRVPGGASIVASHYVVQHDPRFHRDPERFDPDRWSPESSGPDPSEAWFAFGGGHRRCIGEWLARMEGAQVIAFIARRWRLRLEPGHPVEPWPKVTLIPRHGMRMIPEARPQSPFDAV